MSKYDLDLDYLLPLIDISKEELNEIIAEADGIIAENSTSPEKLAVAYLKKGQCLQILDQSAQSNDLDFYDDENLCKTKELLEKALELKADIPEALMRLGVVFFYLSCWYEKGFFDEAMTMLTKAIQLKPDYAAAFNRRSAIYSSNRYSHYKNEDYQDNLGKAIADLTEAIRIRPFDASYYLNRGDKYSKIGEYEKALDDFTSVIKYGSDKFKKETVISLPYNKTYRQRISESLKTAEICLEAIKQGGFLIENVQGVVPEYSKCSCCGKIGNMGNIVIKEGAFLCMECFRKKYSPKIYGPDDYDAIRKAAQRDVQHMAKFIFEL